MFKTHTKSILIVISALFLGLITSCGDDDNPVVNEEPPPPLVTYEATFNINPANFPAGAGLILSAGDTGTVVQLDADADAQWNIMMRTIRTGQGGRPGIYLFGDTETSGAVEGVNISALSDTGTGASAFTEFDTVTVAEQAALRADGVFEFDEDTDVGEDGKPDAQKLAIAYDALVIGDDFAREEADQPVYLIRGRDGDWYKFQMVNLENGGNVTFRWSRFSDGNLE